MRSSEIHNNAWTTSASASALRSCSSRYCRWRSSKSRNLLLYCSTCSRSNAFSTYTKRKKERKVLKVLQQTCTIWSIHENHCSRSVWLNSVIILRLMSLRRTKHVQPPIARRSISSIVSSLFDLCEDAVRFPAHVATDFKLNTDASFLLGFQIESACTVFSIWITCYDWRSQTGIARRDVGAGVCMCDLRRCVRQLMTQ